MNQSKVDVAIIGSGHNALVAACLLAKQNLSVKILEAKPVMGGATRTEYPFAKAPELGTSTASYLLGLMPPEIIEATGAKIEVIRRDPHYFLPTRDGRYLLFGSDQEELKSQFLKFFSEKDWQAHLALQDELQKLREDVGSTWLREPDSIELTAKKYVRPELQKVFIDLCRRPVDDYLARFGFESELLVAMYAVTDAFSGLNASFGMPGTGMNFLVHNMCRLPQADGTWMVAKGGMGSVAKAFWTEAQAFGASLELNWKVSRLIKQGSRIVGVANDKGEEVRAETVLVGADPYSLLECLDESEWPEDFKAFLSSRKRNGTTMKVNLALKSLPEFKCLKENRGQHKGTIHLLPPEENLISRIRKSYDEVSQGRLSPEPTIEWYIHTPVDPSLQDSKGHHNSAFFVQWVPYELSEGRWEEKEEAYVERLFEIAEEFAPGFRDCVVDTFVLTPPKIESHLGIKYGHIHHIDNCYGFSDRLPYQLPFESLYSCSAACHPAGSVIGSAGFIAAKKILRDLGKEAAA